jgi:hypothetical protein
MWSVSYWILTTAHAMTFIAGTVILIRHRRRSRRATTLALVALAGLAGDWLFWQAVYATMRWWEDTALHPAMQVIHLIGWLWRLACLLILVWAVVADRRPTVATAAEADYADAPDPGTRA